MTHYGPEPLPDRDPTPPFEELTPEEAQKAYDEAEPVPLSPERLHEIFDYATRGYPPHDPDADPCRCVDCAEAAWDRLQEAQAESPSEWNQAYKGPGREDK